VVLNYNGRPHVERCVRALEATDWPADRLQIVVVDNASTDGSDVELVRDHPRVVLRRQPRNGGFPANNAALRDLDGVDFVALVNNDAFVTPGWLRPLVDALEADPGLGAACPKLLFAPSFVEVALSSATFHVPGDARALGVRVSGVAVDDADVWRSAQFPPPGFWGIEAGRGSERVYCWTAGEARLRVPQPVGAANATGRVGVRLAAPTPTTVTLACGLQRVTTIAGPEPAWVSIPLHGEPFDVVQNAGSVILEGGYGADRGFLEPDDGRWDEPEEVFAWCGGGVLFRPAYLADTGLFDERFFAYYEDTDMAWRGRARGWRYRYVPASVIRHQHATTSVAGSALFHRYVERNRLLMLTKDAPRAMAANAVWRYVLTTASYARRDIVRPLLRRRRPSVRTTVLRGRSFLAYAALLPHALAERRRNRRRHGVSDAELRRLEQPRP
jgi:GT2 family glycosyltransferase